jgi:hypothetical protein
VHVLHTDRLPVDHRERVAQLVAEVAPVPDLEQPLDLGQARLAAEYMRGVIAEAKRLEAAGG